MSEAAFLEELRALNIRVWADGDTLRCDAPAGGLTATVRDQLRQRKNDILVFLRMTSLLADQQRAIVPLQSMLKGERVPVFAVPGHNGDVFCYRPLVSHLGVDQPFFGLQPPGLDGHGEPLASVEAMATYFASQIRAFRPEGPCVICGYCAGGTVAFELARQLVEQGVSVRFVALFGSPDPAWYRFLPQLIRRIKAQLARVGKHARALGQRPCSEFLAYFREKLRQRNAQRALSTQAEPHSDPVLVRRSRVEEVTLAAVRRYTPGYFVGRIKVLFPCQAWARSAEGTLRWRVSLALGFDEYCGPEGCDGDNMLREPYVSGTAEIFRHCCEQIQIQYASRISEASRSDSTLRQSAQME